MGSALARGSGRWRLVVEGSPDPVTGRRRQFTRTVSAASRKEALTLLGEFRSELMRAGGANGAHSSKKTLKQAAEAWYARAAPNLSANTAAELVGSLRRYVFPTKLAARPVASVTPSDLDALYDHLLKEGGKDKAPLKPATVRKVHTGLSLVFAHAVKREWILSNPALAATPPKAGQIERTPPTVEEVRRLIEAASTDDDGASFSTFLLMAATTGRRRGELCGLR
jgi:integrase